VHLIVGTEQRGQGLPTDDDLVADVIQSDMLGCDRADRCLDWLYYVGSGLRGWVVSERKGHVAAVHSSTRASSSQASVAADAGRDFSSGSPRSVNVQPLGFARCRLRPTQRTARRDTFFANGALHVGPVGAFLHRCPALFGASGKSEYQFLRPRVSGAGFQHGSTLVDAQDQANSPGESRNKQSMTFSGKRKLKNTRTATTDGYLW